jgi:hypothetical protein
MTRLVYLCDVFSQMNDLNLGLQGLSSTMFNMRDKIEAKKSELFSVCINKINTQVFPSLYDFFVCNWTQAYRQCQTWYIAQHLSELGAQLRKYFPETDDTNNWIRYPFHNLPPVDLPISEPLQNCNKRFCENVI